jgi:hypothetical protein
MDFNEAGLTEIPCESVNSPLREGILVFHFSEISFTADELSLVVGLEIYTLYIFSKASRA